MTAPATAFIVNYASAPFGVEALIYPNLDLDPKTGQIVVVGSVPYGVELVQDLGIVLTGQQGGWLPHKRKRKEITDTKRAKIEAKRERRQEYVMRKILNELRGIEGIDPELQALIDEFETPEEIYRSAEEIQAMLKDAYMQNVVLREIRIAEQDKKDEDEIMALLSLTL